MKTGTIAGVLVMVVGVVFTASIAATAKPKTSTTPAGTSSKAPTGVPPLNVNTQIVVPVGVATMIPTAQAVDTGAIETKYNPGGWDYTPLGVS